MAHRGAAGGLRAALLAAVLVLTSAGGPLDELPYPVAPPEPAALLAALRKNLPANWRIGQPTSYLGITQVKVNILDEWRGSPISAAIAMCPGPEDEIWKQVRVFRLIMRWRQRDWPPWECRP